MTDKEKLIPIFETCERIGDLLCLLVEQLRALAEEPVLDKLDS